MTTRKAHVSVIQAALCVQDVIDRHGELVARRRISHLCLAGLYAFKGLHSPVHALSIQPFLGSIFHSLSHSVSPWVRQSVGQSIHSFVLQFIQFALSLTHAFILSKRQSVSQPDRQAGSHPSCPNSFNLSCQPLIDSFIHLSVHSVVHSFNDFFHWM